ncbi:MAG: oxidoreductase [Caulobacterales bacterium]
MTAWFITGVSSGLGREIARLAVEKGETVWGLVRTETAKRDFEALSGEHAHAVIADLSDEVSLRAAIAQAADSPSGIDILVNNAGYGLIGAVEEVSLSEARAQFGVNVFGALAAIQAVLPGMRERGAGRIINITSVSGIATWAGTGIYCASKFALEAIGRTLADEVAPFGIKVTNVAPGGLRTDYASRSLKRAEARLNAYDISPAHLAESILADHAGQESGDPRRAAEAIVALANIDAPPRNLLLGEDALHYAERDIATLNRDIETWRETSLSIKFD